MPDGTAAPRDAHIELETIDYDALLREHAPVLRFDSESEYWNASPETMTEWPENKLRFTNPVSTPCATSNFFAHPQEGGSGWGLDHLVAPPDVYPGTTCFSTPSDHIDADGDDKAAADAYRYGPLDNHVYARAVYHSDNRLWLQYWLFYYYNSMSVLGIGAHQGDWEMVQYRVGSGGVPDVATYAQHQDDAAEACSWQQVEKYTLIEGGVPVRDAPVVYVASASQASYYVAGTHVRGGRPDDAADGDGELRNTQPRLVSIKGSPAWISWLGRWGQDGGSPQSPGQQGAKWQDPKGFHEGVGACSNPDGTPR